MKQRAGLVIGGRFATLNNRLCEVSSFLHGAMSCGPDVEEEIRMRTSRQEANQARAVTFKGDCTPAGSSAAAARSPLSTPIAGLLWNWEIIGEIDETRLRE